jgi:hypothetical protein
MSWVVPPFALDGVVSRQLLSWVPPSPLDYSLWTLAQPLLGDLALRTLAVTVDAVKTVSVAKGRRPDMWPVSPHDLLP